MVDKKLIQDTITELMEANVDKDTIYSTLKDIGVDQGYIDECYSEIINSKSPTTSTTQKKEETPTIKPKESITSQTPKEDLKKPAYVGIDDISSNKREEELKETTTEVNGINEKHESQELKEEIQKFTNPQTTAKPIGLQGILPDDYKILSTQISELEAKVSEIKAQLEGLTKIMKDILEGNRNILTKL